MDTGYNQHKLEEVDDGDGCSHNQVVHRGCIPVVGTWDSCTEVEAAVVAEVVLLYIHPCHSGLVEGDIQLHTPELDAVGGKDCNYSNYCKHNQSVECFRFFLCDFVGRQWCLVATLAHHPKGNRAVNLRFPLQTVRQTFLHPGRHQPGCLESPVKIHINKYLNYVVKLMSNQAAIV